MPQLEARSSLGAGDLSDEFKRSLYVRLLEVNAAKQRNLRRERSFLVLIVGLAASTATVALLVVVLGAKSGESFTKLPNVAHLLSSGLVSAGAGVITGIVTTRREFSRRRRFELEQRVLLQQLAELQLRKSRLND